MSWTSNTISDDDEEIGKLKKTIIINTTVKIESDNTSSLYNYKDDLDNPLNWPKRRKMGNLLIVLSICFMSYFSSTIYIPASQDVRRYFNTNLITINATFSLFLLMNGIAPLFWAPLSECIGRRWVYITAMALYTICTIVCGISKKIGMFFAFRILQGVFACVGQALGSGSVSDMFESHERGKAMSYYVLSLILGPPIASISGGYIDQYLGWQWIFYIMAIMGGILTIVSYFFLSETLYHPNQEKTAVPSSFCDRLKSIQFNPFSTFCLFKYPDIVLVCLPVGIAFGCFYFFVAILPATFGPLYNFDPAKVGLCFIAGGLGNGLGSIVAGRISDRYCIRAAKRNNGIPVKEFRLRLMFVAIPFVLVGPIMYGWFLHFKLHWIAPLIAFTISSFGSMFTVTIATTYLVDANLKVAASAVSINNFSRSLCAMLFSLLAVNIRSALGDGWTYTTLAILMTFMYLVCIPIVIKFGEGWRTKELRK